MLPTENGVGASCVALPQGLIHTRQWKTVLAFLCHRFPAVSADIWMQRMAMKTVVNVHGTPMQPNTELDAALHQKIYYYRAVVQEVPIAAEVTILHQDAHLVVVDKPHGLPVVPSGQYLHETVLVRLKKQLNLPNLVPIHRLDRDTAGVLLFSVQPASRNAYQALFRERSIQKIYHAIAAAPHTLVNCHQFPLVCHSRIVAGTPFMVQTNDETGPIHLRNALTHIDLLAIHGDWALYKLHPITGKRHQLRVHMNALGLPLVGDGIYPILQPQKAMNMDNPLRLLAKSIAWQDPITNTWRCFESRLALKFGIDATLD